MRDNIDSIPISQYNGMEFKQNFDIILLLAKGVLYVVAMFLYLIH